MRTKGKSASENILFIDTSGDQSRIAIFQNDRVIAEKIWSGGKELSETLFVEIEKLLKNARIKLAGISKIAVNPGPGLYTGLRIGITVANFLAWSYNISIVTASASNGKLVIVRASIGKFILPKYWHRAEITKQKSRY